MALFTVIADYRGGTYIKQVLARNVQTALESWAGDLPDVRGSFIGAATKRKIALAVHESDDKPVAIDATTNVWFWYSSGFYVHIVKTAK